MKRRSSNDQLRMAELASLAATASASDVDAAIDHAADGIGLSGFAALLSPRAGELSYLEELARLSRDTTLKNFGRTVRMFVPLYLSNECINVCKYCGFSRDNPIHRVTLSVEQVAVEARNLWEQGFRHILLVAGEHPHFVSKSYLRDCVANLREQWPSISLEVGPLETEEYREIVRAGAEGLVVYQETYDRETYRTMHTSGPKMDFDWRWETAERAHAAGFKRLGIGVLLGLAPWRAEAIALAAHAEHLLRTCWKAQLTISIPRLRPAAGDFEPPHPVTDRELVQLICALRLAFPQIGIVLSTREPSRLRDRLVSLGVTMMSAGSHTEPGGYTGQGKEALHFTKGGRRVELDSSEKQSATAQFEIADDRSAEEVAASLSGMGYEPVWKDWEGVLNGE